MRFGIVGPAERAVAWEKHLRPHHSVSEVVITRQLKDMGSVDACVLLVEEPVHLENALETLRGGIHTFVVSKLPTDTELIEKMYHASEESSVCLQFSHWSSLSPMYQWIVSQVRTPKFIHIIREMDHASYLELDSGFEFLWIEELAYCLKWVNSGVHHINARQVELMGKRGFAIHLFIQFEIGTTAALFIDATADANKHKRFGSNNSYIVDCDVIDQSVRLGQMSESEHLFFQRKRFESLEPAEYASSQFIKSIQMRKPAVFNGYDALRLCQTIDRIQTRLERI